MAALSYRCHVCFFVVPRRRDVETEMAMGGVEEKFTVFVYEERFYKLMA